MRSKENNDFFEEVKIDGDMPVFTSGVVCKLLDIPVWVLKQLDREGIVCPPRKNTDQTRLYSKQQLNKLKYCWYYISQHNVKMGGLKVILKIEQKNTPVKRK